MNTTFHTDSESGTAYQRRAARLYWDVMVAHHDGCDRDTSIGDIVAALAVSDPDAKRLRALARRIWADLAR